MKITFRPRYIVYDKNGKNPMMYHHWNSGNDDLNNEIDDKLRKDVFGLKDVYDYYRSVYVVVPDSYKYDATNDLISFRIVRRDGQNTGPEDRKVVEGIWKETNEGPPVELVKNVLLDFDLILVCDCDSKF